MKLTKARITNYRSVKDSGWINFESSKTIMVGPNEAGKSALLKALQQINAPDDVQGFEALRDYPRGDYNDITTKRVDPAKTDVVVAHFELEETDKSAVGKDFQSATYVRGRRLDNSFWHKLEGVPDTPTINEIRKDLLRLAAYMDSRQAEGVTLPSKALEPILNKYSDGNYYLQGELATGIVSWLDGHFALIEEGNEKEEQRYEQILEKCQYGGTKSKALIELAKRVPVFVLFSNYFRVRPLIHLDHLATRIEKKVAG